MAISTINNPDGRIGDLNNLTTSDKSNVVSAINELNSEIGTVPSGQTVEGQITSLNSNISNKYSKIDNLTFVNNASTGGSPQVEATGGSLRLKTSTGSGNVQAINSGGRLEVYGTGGASWGQVWASSFAQQSSKLVKENIRDIDDDEAKKVLQLRPVSFDYKQNFGGQKNQFGLIAEEAEQVIPYIVNTPNEYDESKFDEQKGVMQPMKGISYEKLIPYLIKMIQIQQNEIDQLKKSI